MKINGLKIKMLLAGGFVVSALGAALLVHAQTAPEFLVSWRASSFIPSDYQGKNLPTKSGNVEIGFDVVDGNKIADLSKNTINWYLGNNQIGSGVGLKTMAVTIPNELSQAVRITVTGYKGADLDFGFLIPVAKPSVILSVKTPTSITSNQRYLPLSSHLFEARPFFFNIRNLGDLSFSWQVNGQPVEGTAGNPNFLTLDLESSGTPKQSQFSVSAAANNLNNQLEFGSRSLNFIVK